MTKKQSGKNSSGQFILRSRNWYIIIIIIITAEENRHTFSQRFNRVSQTENSNKCAKLNALEKAVNSMSHETTIVYSSLNKITTRFDKVRF